VKQLTPYFIYGILLFHILATGYAFYSLYADYTVWTVYHAYPMAMVLFLGAWVGITLKKRWAAFLYFMLVFAELAIKLFFGSFDFGKALGGVLFPLDLLFAFVVLILYKLHFGERSRESR